MKDQVYQEEPGGTFTHDGVEYDLNVLLRLTASQTPQLVSVRKLEWVLEYDTPDPLRVARADLNAPVIVMHDRKDGKERWTVLDGLHRLALAKKLNVRFIRARIVEPEILIHLIPAR